MDAVTRYSVGAVVLYNGIEAAISALDLNWISPFWAPNSILFDQPSLTKNFKIFLISIAYLLTLFEHVAMTRMFRNQIIK